MILIGWSVLVLFRIKIFVFEIGLLIGGIFWWIFGLIVYMVMICVFDGL